MRGGSEVPDVLETNPYSGSIKSGNDRLSEGRFSTLALRRLLQQIGLPDGLLGVDR